MNRRDFLKLGAGLAIGAAVPALSLADSDIEHPDDSGMVKVSDFLTISVVIQGVAVPASLTESRIFRAIGETDHEFRLRLIDKMHSSKEHGKTTSTI